MSVHDGPEYAPGSYEALQHFITDSPWDAERVWAQLRALVPVRRGVLALDDTSFPKQGRHSPGVKRQYCGALGKTANCQVAVSTVLLDDQLAWPLTFELYVPQDWATDAPRRAKAGIPETVRFREKWRMALAHIRRILKADFDLTAVLADGDYGSNAPFRRGLERLGLRYGLAIRGNLTMWTPGARRARPAAALGAAIPDHDWHRVTWGAGTKGALVARFAALRIRPAKSRGDRWLLCERALTTDERKFYLLNLDATATLRELVTLGARPLADRTTVPRTQRRTRDRPLRRPKLSGVGASHRAHRRRVHLPPTRTTASARREPPHAARRPVVGARDHGRALRRQQP